MQDLNICLVQSEQYWENKSGNWDHYSQLLEKIDTPVDLIVLPEMFDTAFSMNTSLAEEWNENSSLSFLKQLSTNHQSAIYTSLMCKEGSHYFNRGVFVRPEGIVDVYDKRKTFGLAGEDKVYTAGKEGKIVEFKGWKIQLQICYDLRFPEISRNYLNTDGEPAYDLLLYVANWPERRALHWKTLLQTRAIENQCYVVGVNRVGKDGNNLVYSGDSVFVNSLGQTVYCISGEEMTKTVSLSSNALNEIRTALPFLKDR
jgi:predicted amidohydrolase